MVVSPGSRLHPRTIALLLALTAAFLLAMPALAADPPAQGDDHAETAEAHGDDAHGASGHGDDSHAAGRGDDSHSAGRDGHGDDHGEHGLHNEHLELPHLIMILRQFVLPPSTSHYTHMFENAFFALVAGLLLTVLAIRVYNNRQDLPGRLQALFEIIVEGIYNLAESMMGSQYAKRHAPFITTVFVYLLVMNYLALVPLGKASTSTFLNNFSIAICVFLYVQFNGIRENGIGGYLHHLAGSPKDAVGWAMSPLLFALELFGEFVKPVSLSLRLFGNIFGEDMLLAVFALLGVVALSSVGSPIGIPFHIPFLFLSLLLGLIQALVFSLLTTVYISLMLPHDHGDHAEAH